MTPAVFGGHEKTDPELNDLVKALTEKGATETPAGVDTPADVFGITGARLHMADF